MARACNQYNQQALCVARVRGMRTERRTRACLRLITSDGSTAAETSYGQRNLLSAFSYQLPPDIRLFDGFQDTLCPRPQAFLDANRASSATAGANPALSSRLRVSK
jgi:hypothetical protein